MASIWDMLFPGGGQAPQFADPNGNPNAQLPVPPQQAPYFGGAANEGPEWQNMANVYQGISRMANPQAFSGAVGQMPQAGIDDRRAESIPLIDRALMATTGMTRTGLVNAVNPAWYVDHKPRAEIEADIAAEKTPLAREAGTGSLDALQTAQNLAWYRSQHPELNSVTMPQQKLFDGGQAPQVGGQDPNARVPVPFPGPQQAPYFGAQMNAQQPAPQAPSPTPNDSYDVRLNLLQQAQQQYPVLRGQNYGYVEKLTPDTSAGYLEHWSPGDAGNTSGTGTGPYDVPRPAQLPLDRPGLEIRNPATRPIDVLGDIVSHNLVNTDPKVKQAYSDLQGSLTPQQQNLLQDQYKYAQKNEQETGTFEDWKQRSGMPGLFRGYAFDQWPKEFTDKVYTPQQKQKLDDMMQYLRGEQQGSSLPIPPQAAPNFGPQMTAQQRYRAAQAGDESRMPSFQRTGPTLPGMIAQSMEDTGRMMTTAPPAMPKGAYMDAGGPAQGTADPQAFANWLGEMRQRNELAPSMALGMIGGGTAFAPRGALGSAGAKLVQPAAEATAEAAQPGIRAYHGSPHDFTQFDLSKIGTGEGAQAYGHGLYFAENEPVAKQYRDVLTRRGVNDTEISPTVTGNALFDLAVKNGEVIDGKIPFGPNRSLMTRDQIVGGFEQGKFSPFDLTPAKQREIVDHIKPRGHMYEVNIGAHPEQFLDWDKPISQQNVPPHLHERASDALEQRGISTDPRSMTGADLYRGLSAQTDHFGAAEQLRDAGIPGIRYLDQGSRRVPATLDLRMENLQRLERENAANPDSALTETLRKERAAIEQERKAVGQGTSNYVVFDPKMIEIMRKYGIAGLLSSGAASQLPIPPQKAPVF